MKTYRTRVSVGLLLLIAAICIPCAIAALVAHDIMRTIMIIAVVAVIIGLLFSIKYVIDGETLRVYYLPWCHTDIDIKTITKMERSHNLISSPAASLKRLKISYGKWDSVLVSPRNEDDFIDTVNKIRHNSDQ